MALAKTWLLLYNVALTGGWMSIGLKACAHFATEKTNVGLYTEVLTPLLFFQTAAIFEIIHAVIGIVRSNPLLAALQISSRFVNVWAVLYLVPETRDSLGASVMLFAWVLTEVIRYPCYAFGLFGSVPYVLKWLRYSLFVILYPMGLVGELMTVYSSLEPVSKSGIGYYGMPNVLNIIFSFHFILCCLLPTYIFYFPQLYFHMFVQRKKALAPPQKID